MAQEVLTHHFRGKYVEANAISPNQTRHIAAACAERDVLMLAPHTTGLPQGSATDNNPKRSVSHNPPQGKRIEENEATARTAGGAPTWYGEPSTGRRPQ
ncbi:hypothetical protein [Streptomyces sp. NBC_01518]|uniref:hypothetical protein n=1 Tax=Streptomyces sp. NBC_01518 TaxID=2903891 RepID=UPI00386D4DB4